MMDENLKIDNEPKLQDLPLKEAPPIQNKISWTWLLLLCLALGGVMAAVTYKQRAGMQWLIFVVLFELCFFVFALIRKNQIPLSSVFLALINALIASITVFRTESFTTVLAVLSNLVGLGLLAGTFLNGQWLVYRLREYIVEAIRLALSMLGGFFRLGFKDETEISNVQFKTDASKNLKTLKPYLIGFLIALPILLIFGTLFASADPVFAEKSQALFSWIHIENLRDLVIPLIQAVIIAYISFGAITFAFTRGALNQKVSPDQPLFKPFLGITESMVVLVLLNVLFASFLFIQFKYFFGGGQNINISGYTYSEYARKGFFELLTVALFAGSLHWGLNALTSREHPRQKISFALGFTLLYIQVAVVLVAAFNRMQLYVKAYGLTQERLLPQIFMIFLGLILLALLVMEWHKHFDRVAIVLTLSLLIFTAVVAGMNVDHNIASYNLQLANTSGKLDGSFAVERLSADAVPVLFEAYDDKALPNELHETLGKVLACKAARLGSRIDTQQPWFATNLIDARVKNLFVTHRLELAQYTFESGDGGSGFQFAEGFVFCDFSYNSD
ncbi:MAG TPA: DUF4173 domain-containing protein [Anaerolineaceae bacterium]|nr:DUF4173 domain-containing protein [Anaerolineaceae bacterium]